MKHFLYLLIMFLSISSASYADDKLLQSTDFSYVGSFKLPSAFSGTATDVPKAMAYYPSGNNGVGSLYISGPFTYQYIGELAIPTLYTGSTKSSIPDASILQNPSDITAGNKNLTDAGHTSYAGGGSIQLAGLAIDSGKLYGGVYATYNANTETIYSHFVHASMSVSTTSVFSGLYQMGNAPSAGYVGGYMGLVPSAYQTAFGGKILTGQGYISVISQTSAGPGVFVFNPSDMTGSNNTIVPTVPLIYYPPDHQTLGAYGTTNSYVSINDRIMGVVFPEGSRSVLFFGRHGTGTSCYGPGTSDPTEAGRTNTSSPNTCAGTTVDPGNVCCLDYSDHGHGTHSYPYNYQVWAYDANDLTAVKAGSKNPWEPTPYAMWTLPLQWNDQGQNGFHVGINGVAYDAVNQRIFVNQVGTDIIQVFNINVTGSSDTTAPVITAFTMPSTATSTTVSVSSFTATDAVGVTGFCITTVNSSSGCSWSGSAPTTVTGSAGSNTWYAWAKDAAGNVSTASTAATTITISGGTASSNCSRR